MYSRLKGEKCVGWPNDLVYFLTASERNRNGFIIRFSILGKLNARIRFETTGC